VAANKGLTQEQWDNIRKQLKNDDMALARLANLAALVCINVQIGPKNYQKSLNSRKIRRNFRVEGRPENRQAVGYAGFRYSSFCFPLTGLVRD